MSQFFGLLLTSDNLKEVLKPIQIGCRYLFPSAFFRRIFCHSLETDIHGPAPSDLGSPQMCSATAPEGCVSALLHRTGVFLPSASAGIHEYSSFKDGIKTNQLLVKIFICIHVDRWYCLIFSNVWCPIASWPIIYLFMTLSTKQILFEKMKKKKLFNHSNCHLLNYKKKLRNWKQFNSDNMYLLLWYLGKGRFIYYLFIYFVQRPVRRLRTTSSFVSLCLWKPIPLPSV